MRRLAQVAVVAMATRVDGAGGDGMALELLQLRGEPPREVVAARKDADQHHLAGAVVALDDLVGDARQRSPDLLRVHHCCLDAALGDAHASTRSRRAIRMYMPLRAWRKYAARGSASTSGAISSTRGSGCMTIADWRSSDIARPSTR